MKRITKTQKVGFGAVSVMVLMCIGYVFFLDHIYTLRDDLLEVKAKLATVKQLEENKLETLVLLSKTEADRKKISSYFVSVEDPTPFLELIENLGSEADVTLEVETLSVEEQDTKDGKNIHENVKVVLVVEGDWESLYELFLLLEHMPYLTTISQAAFSVDTKSGSSDVWKGQIELHCSAM